MAATPSKLSDGPSQEGADGSAAALQQTATPEKDSRADFDQRADRLRAQVEKTAAIYRDAATPQDQQTAVALLRDQLIGFSSYCESAARGDGVGVDSADLRMLATKFQEAADALYAAPAVQPPEQEKKWLASIEKGLDGYERALDEIAVLRAELARRAAVQPIPREPTEAMICAGMSMIPIRYPGRDDVCDAWRAMYDAFTNEQPKSTEP